MRALIVDDEEYARARLTRLLGEGGVEVVAEAGDAEAAEDMLRTSSPDVVFLDIDMPGRSGLQLAGNLGTDTSPQIVFVTAHAEHAVEAFELAATDYLLKPVSRARLMQCVERLGKQRESKPINAPAEAPVEVQTGFNGQMTRVLVKSGNRMQFLHLDEVKWIESADNYTRLHAKTNTFLVRGKLSDFEQKLDPAKFIRIHRRTIVNVEAIKEFEPWSSGELIVVLHDKTKLKLSRTYRDRLRAITGDL